MAISIVGIGSRAALGRVGEMIRAAGEYVTTVANRVRTVRPRLGAHRFGFLSSAFGLLCGA
ncbi:hypothetical protein QFW77_15880 [Luteimonas sp. RD2P54]|uniref:Uncharacterized protein n=1 Tax=Luteimonas endophytica TaxID=3042023 RepID=A0ABT6JC90_9GAMM|nr:hypothetical protein [Luteimonas endophytica]MDH5824454.1 hypothetical protein [Luteimonas endophytica]